MPYESHQLLPRTQYAHNQHPQRMELVQDYILQFHFGDTSPYVADSMAFFGDILTDADMGICMPRAGRVVELSLQSDEGIGTEPSSDCDVRTFVDGSVVAAGDLSWSGSDYHLVGYPNVDFAENDHLSFQYIDDGVGQSAGKVIGWATIRFAALRAASPAES